MRGRLVVAAALIGVLSLATTGCGRITAALKPADKIVTREATVAVAAAAVEGNVQVARARRSAALADGEGRPIRGDRQRSESWNETLLVADTFDDVLAGMVTGLEKAGWQVETIDASVPEAQTVRAQRCRQQS